MNEELAGYNHPDVRVLFTGTLFLSALLLFMIQPLFAKMALPRLGGTPAVWNTCVVFFQLTLLAGYAYTHGTVRWLGVRRQALAHLVVLALPLLLLPIAIGPTWEPPATANPVYWLLLLLAAVVGLPFFAVSTSAPLLQRWFAETNHPQASDPFFLYAASNLGSLGALLAYPIAIEPFLRLQTQARIWAAGYIALVVCVAACAWVTRRSSGTDAPRVPESPAAAVPWRMRFLWLALAAVPSSLMLSVTTYVSTDIAAVPLLWIVPLALYLLTFVIVFARRPLFSFDWVTTLFPLIVLLPAITIVMRHTPPLAGIPLHFIAFFAVALVCHGRLARLRPSAGHLTEFYLWMSIGGAVGGIFNTLVAPLIFVTTAEYPLGLVAACLLSLPTGRVTVWRPFAIDVLTGALILGVTWGLLTLAQVREPGGAEWIAFGRTYAIPFALTLLCWRRAPRFALALGAVLVAHHLHTWTRFPVLHTERTFFGQHQISDRGGCRYLTHGTTSHGSQALDAALRCEPTTYYARSGPIGQLFGSFVGAGTKQHIGVIGLGTGSMAAYARPGQQWTFFEINPAVVDYSEGRYFTYLTECVNDYTIMVGDGRRRLSEAPDASFDVLVFDAFSSDAIPVHLITLEALELYLRKLAPGGVMAFHVSNRYLNLEPVLGSLADRLSLVALMEWDFAMTSQAPAVNKAASKWVVAARTREDLGDVARDTRWTPIEHRPDVPVWTDDFSNIVRTIRWGW
jgi:SAM-dependent methyltransferase